MTPMEQQFIEVVAREIHTSLGAHSDLSCKVCDRTNRDQAAILLGMLRASNGMVSIREIVTSAHIARGCHSCEFDSFSSALFRAIAVEALGGAKVSEEYGEIRLDPLVPDVCSGCGKQLTDCAYGDAVQYCCPNCTHTDPVPRPFSVPLLTIEGATV